MYKRVIKLKFLKLLNNLFILLKTYKVKEFLYMNGFMILFLVTTSFLAWAVVGAAFLRIIDNSRYSRKLFKDSVAFLSLSTLCFVASAIVEKIN